MRSIEARAYAASEAAQCESEGMDVRLESNGRYAQPKNLEPTTAAEKLNSLIVWNGVVDCEARNALQVILGGGEILLDPRCALGVAEQRLILERMISSAHHLNTIIATLSRQSGRSDEVLFESATEELSGFLSKLY
jgi:hypothetical protein